VSETVATMDAMHRAQLEAPPYGVQTKKLVMWLFIIADASTFGAILFGYGYLRVASPNWTRPFTFWPTIAIGFLMTALILTSSLTMVGAVVAAKQGRRSAAVGWLGATLLLGAMFAALHVQEWVGLIREGWSLSSNPLGGSTLVGATFFTITGLSLLHVVVGVVALAVIALGLRSGRFDAPYVETTGLYWQFVDVVWMFVFPLVYLLNVR
jgi:cytochrome c oxidase subunit 3